MCAPYPEAIAQALSQLRLVGVNGPYTVLLGADAYTALAETSDHGYPVLEHVKRLVKDEIIWAPRDRGARFVLTQRGGRFCIALGPGCFHRLLEPQRLRGAALPAGELYLPDAYCGGRSGAGRLQRRRRSLEAKAQLSVYQCFFTKTRFIRIRFPSEQRQARGKAVSSRTALFIKTTRQIRRCKRPACLLGHEQSELLLFDSG